MDEEATWLDLSLPPLDLGMVQWLRKIVLDRPSTTATAGT